MLFLKLCDEKSWPKSLPDHLGQYNFHRNQYLPLAPIFTHVYICYGYAHCIISRSTFSAINANMLYILDLYEYFLYYGCNRNYHVINAVKMF